MPGPRRSPSPAPRKCRLAALASVLALAAPGVAQALDSATPAAASAPVTTSVPASARITPQTGGTAIAPTGTPTTTVGAPAATSPAATVGTPAATLPSTTTATPGTSTTIVPGSATSGNRPPAPRTSHAAGKMSTPAIALAALAALLALACLIWAIARAQAIEPRWAQSLRHSLAEGGFRVSATWAELTDWARLGR